MRKECAKPEMEVIEFATEDVITASGEIEGERDDL